MNPRRPTSFARDCSTPPMKILADVFSTVNVGRELLFSNTTVGGQFSSRLYYSALGKSSRPYYQETATSSEHNYGRTLESSAHNSAVPDLITSKQQCVTDRIASFDGNRLGEIARLIDVGASLERGVIGE